MANQTRYFDLSPAVAGFGTLTGAWDTITANWTASSAGAASTNVAYTFDNTDTAQFGFTGTTGTAGTATISNGVTVTLNQIVTANLTGLQTIAANGTGALALAGTTPTINVGSAGGLNITGAITGTAGFTKAGTGKLVVTNTANNLSGTITNGVDINTGYMVWGGAAQSGNVFPNVTNVVLNGGINAPVVLDSNAAFNHPSTFTGAGTILVSNTAAAGITFAAGALGGMTGTGATTAGFSVYPKTGQLSSYVNVNDFPAGRAGWLLAGASPAGYIKFVGSTGTLQTYGTDLYIDTVSGAPVSGTPIIELYANGTAGSALKLTGPVTRAGTNLAAVTLTIRGTNANNNELSGNITDFSAGFTIAIKKDDAGRWILSGANTYQGATSISAGTLVAANSAAFGSSTSGVITQTGGTIELASSVNKGLLATTLISNAGATALSLPTSGNSYTYTCGGVTLSSTIIVDVAASSTLTMANSGAMAGVGFGITKNSAGEYILNNTANTFTGAVTVSAGTLSITALANTSSNSSLGTGAGTSAIALTGTLKYIGTTGTSTNRSITFTGAAPVLDASGTVVAATATYSACTQAAGARTITFTGTNLGANTFSAGLADTGVGALVSVSKQGAGKWILSGALTYTGTTTVATGTLNLGGINRTLSGALSISGGTLENSTNTVSANTTMTGGTITAELTGAKTLDVNSGSDATLQPTNNANTFSGNTTVAAGGVLKLITGVSPATAATGRVLGTSAVSVSGTIKTGASAPQRGQMRYGGNLTFNSGAVLNIGGA